MTSHRTRTRRTLARQAAELAVAAPQVIASRLGRLALAGANPSSRDRREFARMIIEKQAAAGQAFAAMAAQGWLAAPLITASFVRAAWTPWFGGPHPVVAQVQDSAERVLAGALAPVHRAAVANARRLTRPRRRK
jgi:hypothetical protein